MEEHQPDAERHVHDVVNDALAHAFTQQLERDGRWEDPRQDEQSHPEASDPMVTFAVTRAQIALGDGSQVEQVLLDLARDMWFEGHIAGFDRAMAQSEGRQR